MSAASVPTSLEFAATVAPTAAATPATAALTEAVARAKRWLVANPLRADSEFFYYAAYYCAQVGAGFDEQLLLTRQEADGSWPANANLDDEQRGGRLYTTALAVLALTAKEHYLPSTVE